ncbi:uncharacterized protein LOC105442045 [Strongylocentrotus purpuratus]|uniref:Uncharacterized protein n=1 Tax=Strongylocentrotus purpuratus TaxID=7668 RepID=A0A7M7P6J3_STRPU|nr:uncharacterized protein LOC105442045 [Strongylocentrotus purpuratus]|eukprot:XP_011672099.1 PREDICTED: uncharacterized protein LOC105442045 [Strongylocentrotus purpuratus]
MGISIKLASVFCLVFLASTVIEDSHAMVFISKIALHLSDACPLFAEEVLDEGGKCDPDVIEEVIDEVDEIELPGANPDMIERYLEEAEQGKMCFSPDGANVLKLQDGCATMDAVCTGKENVMYCSQMASVTTETPNTTLKTTTRPKRID